MGRVSASSNDNEKSEKRTVLEEVGRGDGLMSAGSLTAVVSRDIGSASDGYKGRKRESGREREIETTSGADSGFISREGKTGSSSSVFLAGRANGGQERSRRA
jgi:hypothetical protein